MQCPHCEYKDYTYPHEPEPEHGRFYELSNEVVAIRRSEWNYGNKETTPVYACPVCRKLFI